MSFVLVVCQRHIDRSMIELHCDDHPCSTLKTEEILFINENLFIVRSLSIFETILFNENIDGAHRHSTRRSLHEQENLNRMVHRRLLNDKY